MKLSDFFATVTPYLQGQAAHAPTARALFGDASGPDAERWAVYGELCRLRRLDILDSLYAHCARVVRQRQGPEAWAALVEAYFQAHPMRAVELNANGAWLPEFLAHYAPAHGLPDWLPELADLEWCEWVVLVAPDEAPAGPRPCLDPAVDLRPYTHDFVSWMDSDPRERAEAPAPGDHLVLFWREGAGGYRRENASPLELCVLKALHEGHALDAVAREAGLPVEALTSVLDALTEAGVVRG